MKFRSRCKYRYKNKYGNMVWQWKYSYKNEYGIWQSIENTNTRTNMVFDTPMQIQIQEQIGIWQSNENTNTTTNMVFDRAVQVYPACQVSSQQTNGGPPSLCVSSQVRFQSASSWCHFYDCLRISCLCIYFHVRRKRLSSYDNFHCTP